MGKKIKIAIAGVGNCASAIIQGGKYYTQNTHDTIGLTAFNIGGYEPGDIEVVAAFDVADTKVGKDVSEAIYARPNNTITVAEVPHMGITVQKGPTLDGVGRHLSRIVTVSQEPDVNVKKVLQDSGAEMLVNYLPVGSTNAVKHYASQALEAGVGFLNAIPVFIASEPKWQQAFADKKIPLAGDDVMSQLGATVVHKTLVKLFVDRGVQIDGTYQLNIGGDMDFYNMLDEERLEDKRISKTSAVKAMADYDIPMRIGPSDYVDFIDNEKICYINLEGKYFGKIPVKLDLKLKVIDAYNSAGIMIDAIRGLKIALDRKLYGPMTSISSYCFKHPPVQMPYNEAKKAFGEFVEGKRNN
ncbi:inositol-3-phosphate synthase [Candidatus Nitrosotalea okcheonensis]|uniref:Inositol-3-phosphate synthase n=1 Tax=Candidatus Nitrosotalea okcheonensis TaxID=1903276 RepID=A0A2H1FD14_9ARCH|nr:inositol-3-phosphate synthase [Candidatus Nitrosotalea okcheonensis]MDE1728506.1 inositol-3-phosphate synthase [Nitrososphaerota archaeon]MDE1831040.1 inositol-3-phosphate synthase [Nitrososphaerota archaeon]MDE1840643.1 inositol-3-phosphate synthase [Nitrososphaerota archaeon]MDE1877767.1 inositol-3-phosphate synthase [Nitrososphaerota archaeon]SMH70654.1 Inositol-3-phosphate synthase [Candidatus Nitrosotalea okcheonensis]